MLTVRRVSPAVADGAVSGFVTVSAVQGKSRWAATITPMSPVPGVAVRCARSSRPPPCWSPWSPDARPVPPNPGTGSTAASRTARRPGPAGAGRLPITHPQPADPHLVPPAMAKTTSCRLTLPRRRVGPLDIVAARATLDHAHRGLLPDQPPRRPAPRWPSRHTLNLARPLRARPDRIDRACSSASTRTWFRTTLGGGRGARDVQTRTRCSARQPMRTDLMARAHAHQRTDQGARRTLLFRLVGRVTAGRPGGRFSTHHGITEGHIEDSRRTTTPRARWTSPSPTSDPRRTIGAGGCSRTGWWRRPTTTRSPRSSSTTTSGVDCIPSRGGGPTPIPSGDTTNPTLRHLDHVPRRRGAGLPGGSAVVRGRRAAAGQKQELRFGPRANGSMSSTPLLLRWLLTAVGHRVGLQIPPRR